MFQPPDPHDDDWLELELADLDALLPDDERELTDEQLADELGIELPED